MPLPPRQPPTHGSPPRPGGIDRPQGAGGDGGYVEPQLPHPPSIGPSLPSANPATGSFYESVAKVNGSNWEIIGLKGNGEVRHTESAGTLTVTHPSGSAEWAEQPDQVRLQLTNESGSVTATIVGAAIFGYPVIRQSGGEGWLIDDYENPEEIDLYGEQTIEVGNNMVVQASQLNQLCHWWWGFASTKKHLYSIAETGFLSYFAIGEWYTLKVTSTKAWQTETVDSTVECISVECEIRGGDAGSSRVTFREIYQNWVYDDSAVTARFSATAAYGRTPEGRQIRVGSSATTKQADYYCDGTADEVEIQAAIAYAAATACGVVELTDGRFYPADRISMTSSITLQMSTGTVLVPNFDDYCIAAIGTAGAHLSNVAISGGRIARTGTDIKWNIYADYVDAIRIEAVRLDEPYLGIYVSRCTSVSVVGNVIDGKGTALSSAVAGVVGIYIYSSDRCDVSGNHVYDMNCSDLSVVGIQAYTLGTYGWTIRGNHVSGLTSDGTLAAGIYVDADKALIDGNRVEGCKNTNVSDLAFGIYLPDTVDFAEVKNNVCVNNGDDLDSTNTNGDNFHDEGTDTQTWGNSWQ